MFTKTLSLFSRVALLGAVSFQGAHGAITEKGYPEREVVQLRSVDGHGGNSRWSMQKAELVAADGAAISKPDFNAKGWGNAIVPGTVLNSLVAAKVYPEPYYGLNNQREKNLIPDISEAGPAFYTYWFRTQFAVPSSFKGKQVWLQFDGINYTAEIWVNGQQVGSLAGMFQRGLFNITKAASIGDGNTLAVLVRPIDPPNGFRPSKVKDGKAVNENGNGSDGKIGAYVTQLMTAGWDFTFIDGIRDRNTGIWRDVNLFATSSVILRHPFVTSILPIPDTSSSEETISVEVTNPTDQSQNGVLKATIEEGKIAIEQPVELQPKETRTVVFTPAKFPALKIKNPRLWWPFNKGDQPLYHLSLKFDQQGHVSDELKSRFGIRDIRSDQNTPDKSRIFYVNGKRLFLQGSNWISEAMCRTSEERTAAELRYTRQAGVNFLRFWAGGVTESDQFFDLCDELGILVWTEFWQTGNTTLPVDKEVYRANVVDTVKRLRNHASLAYYVSANERDAKGIVPIEDLLKELDGTRGYQPGSETDGVHDGSPYGTGNPMWYYEDTGSDRGSRINGLCPEYGVPIMPTIDCLREMMDEADIWPINKPVWDYLDGGAFHGMTRAYADGVRQYGPVSSADEYAWKGQMFGALAYRALWECWNANRFEYGDRFSTGVLFWYHNSPNRQTCGRMWDWSLEPTAALYFSQKAHEPLHVQYDFLKNTVGVNNEWPRSFQNLTVTARILNFDMTEVFRQQVKLDVPADRFVKDVLSVTLPEKLSPIYFIKLTISDAAGKLLSDNFYWASNKPYKPGRSWTGPLYQGMTKISDMPKVTLTSSVVQTKEEGKNINTVTVKNPSNYLAFMVWLRLQDTKTGKPIRPAFYEDNFVSLLPGESRTIRIEYSGQYQPGDTKLIVDGWNVERTQHQAGKVTVLPDVHPFKRLSLAEAKPVAVSGAMPGMDSNNAVDGDSATRWSSLYADNQWIQIDLGQPVKFSSVGLIWERSFGTEYKIQASDDAQQWRDLAHVTEGKGGDEEVKFPAATARYVRLFGIQRSNPRYGFSLWEINVYP